MYPYSQIDKYQQKETYKFPSVGLVKYELLKNCLINRVELPFNSDHKIPVYLSSMDSNNEKTRSFYGLREALFLLCLKCVKISNNYLLNIEFIENFRYMYGNLSSCYLAECSRLKFKNFETKLQERGLKREAHSFLRQESGKYHNNPKNGLSSFRNQQTLIAVQAAVGAWARVRLMLLKFDFLSFQT